MSPKLKRLNEQVIVITGASSGIGLTTAEMAAERGAKVVLAARSEHDLTDAVARIRRRGGQATAVAADVADEAQVERIANHAMAEYGRIDTWVNNAGQGMYGRMADQPMPDKRRLFDINFWGTVYGCKYAIEHMRMQGGCIINVGSELSDLSVPLQGIYAASKHAMKGYTDSLRMELEHDRVPIWVTLVKPGPIDTPYPQHARNYMAQEPKHGGAAYPPEDVARTILTCAEKPVREITVGGIPRLQIALGMLMPRLSELYTERMLWSGQQRDEPAVSGDSLDAPSGEDYGRRRSSWPTQRMPPSLYTRAALSDAARALPLIAVGAVAAEDGTGRSAIVVAR